VRRFGDRFHRFELNAIILLVSSSVTSALGFIYWAAAERLFSTDAVGRASTIVATATMLGAIGSMALGSMYERFLTSTGPHLRRAVLIGAGVVTAACALLGIGLAALQPVPALFPHRFEEFAMPAVVVSFGLFALADPILIGLREPSLVAWKNITVSVVKLAALVVVAAVGTDAAGIYGSWSAIALVAAVLAIGWAAVRGDPESRRRPPSLPSRKVLWAHHRAVLSLMLMASVAPTVIPLMVVHHAGLTVAAYYNVAAIIVTAVAMLDIATASSYVSEAGHPRTDTAAITRRLLRVKAVVAAATVIALAVVGPLMLRLVGPNYAEAASGFLRLMAIAAVAQLYIGLYALLCRIESRLGLLTAVQLVSLAALIGGVWWALPQWGLTGVAVVFIIVEASAAAVVTVPAWRALNRLLRTSSATATEKRPADEPVRMSES